MKIDKDVDVGFVLFIVTVGTLLAIILTTLIYNKIHTNNVRKDCTLIYTTKYVEKDRPYKSTTYDFVHGHEVYSCLDSIPYGYSIYK